MDVKSHTFSLDNLKQLILEWHSLCDDSERRINNLSKDNVSDQCVVCFKGVFGSHNVVVAHAPSFHFDSTNLHFFHGSCRRKLEETWQGLDSRKICPGCQKYPAPEIEFSSVAHAVVSGQIDHALQLIELEDPESTHSWHEANMSALHIAAFNGEKI